MPRGQGIGMAVGHGQRAISLRDVLLRHRWAIGLMESRRNGGPANLRHHDAVIASLRAGGMDIVMTAHAYSLLDSYIYGFALTQMTLPFETAEEVAEVAQGMRQSVDLDAYPHLVEMIAHADGAPLRLRRRVHLRPRRHPRRSRAFPEERHDPVGPIPCRRPRSRFGQPGYPEPVTVSQPPIARRSGAPDKASDVLRASRHPLDPLFRPQSVAVIGATEKAGSVGRTVLWNLISNPFGGTVLPDQSEAPQHPRHQGLPEPRRDGRAGRPGGHRHARRVGPGPGPGVRRGRRQGRHHHLGRASARSARQGRRWKRRSWPRRARRASGSSGPTASA